VSRFWKEYEVKQFLEQRAIGVNGTIKSVLFVYLLTLYTCIRRSFHE